jgi:myo-inositol-1(or 4)-monophosphatase
MCATIAPMYTDLEFTFDLTHRAGELLRGYYSAQGLAAQRKADQTVVTVADLAADKLIAEAIGAAYPSDAIISEEQHTSLDGILRPTWVVDPLDGTTNFSLGFPTWGVSIARFVDGWPALGVVYFPLLGEYYSAEKGRGAFYNGSPLTIPLYDPTDQRQHAFACCARTHKRYHVSVPYKYRILGSAAYNLCSVARGSALVSFDTIAKIWDIAAAWLIVEEAGGAVSCLNNASPFPALPGSDFNAIPYPTLGAANAEILKQTRQQLQPK